MRYPVGFLARRWWWAKWHPAVRLGWIVTRGNRSGSPTQTAMGLGLIALGVILRSRRSLHLYSTTIDAGRTVAVRNVSGTGA